MNPEIIQTLGAGMMLVGAFGFLFSKQRTSEAFRVIQWLGLSVLFYSESQQLGLATVVMGLLLLGVETIFLSENSPATHESSSLRVVLGIVAVAFLIAPFVLSFPEQRQTNPTGLDWHAYFMGYESVLIRAAFVVLSGIYFLGTLKRSTHE